jgi:hypothetical protein
VGSEQQSTQSAQPRPNRIPSISLPKGGGALRSIDEKFSVNAANGTCNINIPLPFSAARSDVGLNIALQYNSGSGNSAFGLGWNLSLPSIQRRTDKQLPMYQDALESDVFIFSGAEDLVPAYSQNESGDWLPDLAGSAGIRVERYRPRIDGLFARIEKISVQGEAGFYWKVITRDNVATILGRTPGARIADPLDASRIFRWLPEWTYDDRGNCVEYLYKEEDLANVPDVIEERNRRNGLQPLSNKHLKRIRYGNHNPYFPNSSKAFDPPPPQDPAYFFEATLDYGEHGDADPTPEEVRTWTCRFDPFSDCRPGFEMRTYRLCRRILFFHSFAELEFAPAPYLVRSLDFKYQSLHFDGAPYQSQEADFIIGVQRTHYKRTSAAAYDSKSWPAVDLTYQPLNWNKNVQTVSQDDLVGAPARITRDYQWLDLYGDGAPGIFTEQAEGWYFKSNLGGGHFGRAEAIAEKPSFIGVAEAVLEFHDLAADGSKQLVSLHTEPHGFFELDDDNRWLPFRKFAQLANVDFLDPNTKLLDLNGDGAPDLLISEEFVFRWHPSLGRVGYGEASFSAKPLTRK